jgi:hypothetical protein
VFTHRKTRRSIRRRRAGKRSIDASEPWQVGKLQLATMHVHLAVFGTAVQRRHGFARVQQSGRIEGALDRMEGLQAKLDKAAGVEADPD